MVKFNLEQSSRKREGTNEVSSDIIRKFDDEEDRAEAFHDNDNSAYDAVFGRKKTASTKDKSALSKEGKSKRVLFSILVIVLITFVSSVLSQRRRVGSNRSNDQYHQTKGNKGSGTGETDDNFFYDSIDKSGDNDQIVYDGVNDNDGNGNGNGNGNDDEDDNPNYDGLFGPKDEVVGYDQSSSSFNGDDDGDDGDDKSFHDQNKQEEKKTKKNDSQQYKENTKKGDADALTYEEKESNQSSNEIEDNEDNGDNDDNDNNNLKSSYDEDLNTDFFNEIIDPEKLESRFGNVFEGSQNDGDELPFLFYIPRTGSALIEQLLLKCHGLVAASERGEIGDNGYEPFLEVITTPSDEKFVNVELRTPGGIARAIDLDLVGSELAEVIFASRIVQVSNVYHTPYRGKCFTLLRDPVDRAISLFYALKDSPWEHSFKKEFSDMTLEDYAFSKYIESNWLTRMLTNTMSGAIGDDELENAKHFLKNKCLIGLTDTFDESHERFERYFGWDDTIYDDCQNELKERNKQNNEDRHLDSIVSQTVLDQLRKQNELDILLYEYAIEIYKEQESFFA